MLPVEPISYPACLAGQSNGELELALLWSTPGLAGGPTVRLVEPAARSWRAMTAAALAAGHTLKATSATDSYRDLDQQIRIFRIRYTRTVLDGRPYRWWDSDGDGVKEKWYQRPNTAVAAVPGTSNHGWGLAVDTGEEIDGDAGTESLDAATLEWLLAHAWDYGWSWEVQSERWHIRYCTGDDIPDAVRRHEERMSDMDLQCLVRYTDDPNPRRVWLCNRMLRREVAEEELVDAGTSATYLAAVIAGTQPATGGVADISGLAGGPLANGGKVFQTNGYTAPRRDTWGVDVATFAGSGLAPSGPVDLSDDALAEVRELVDEELDEQSRAGADTDQ